MSERFDYDGLLEVNQTLSAENARLRRGLENCHMLARRIVTSESAFFKINSAHHIIRMCEEAGVTSVKGVLKDAALQPERGGHPGRTCASLYGVWKAG